MGGADKDKTLKKTERLYECERVDRLGVCTFDRPCVPVNNGNACDLCACGLSKGTKLIHRDFV